MPVLYPEYESYEGWKRYFIGHFPDGTSVKVMSHFAQMIHDGKMQYYNYGEAMNLEKYGTKTPRAVSIENWKTVNLPMAIYAAFWDELTTYAQAKAMNEYIGPKNVKMFHVQPGGHEVWTVAKNNSFLLTHTIPFIKEFASPPFSDVLSSKTTPNASLEIDLSSDAPIAIRKWRSDRFNLQSEEVAATV